MARLKIRSPWNDAELLRRFQTERDADIFAEIIARHGPGVRRYCLRRLSVSDAEDAFQAVFLVFALRADSIREHAYLGSWLLGTARRVVRQANRNRKYRSLPAEVCVTPKDQSEAWLEEELSLLPVKLREPTMLCLVEGLTQSEAASQLGISERTLRRRLDQGKDQLRHQLIQRGLAPSIVLTLLSSTIPCSASVPNSLIEATLATTFGYILGELPSHFPPVLFAQGVLSTMLYKLVTLSLVGLAIAFSAVSIGFTQSDPVASPQKAQPKSGLPPVLPAFRVTSDIAAYQRTVQRELEYQYPLQTDIWTGGILEGPKATCQVQFSRDIPGSNHHTVTSSLASLGFIFDSKTVVNPTWSQRTLEYIRIGPHLDHAVLYACPTIAKRSVLASYCSPQNKLPDWVDYTLAEQLTGGNSADYLLASMLNLLRDGHAIRLRKFLGPQNSEGEFPFNTFHIQGPVFLEFLLSPEISHHPDLQLSVRIAGEIRKTAWKDIPPTTPLSQTTLADRRPSMAVAEFIKLGISQDWDVAVKTVYGYEKLEDLEAAWVKWIQQRTNKRNPVDDPDRIPAVRNP